MGNSIIFFIFCLSSRATGYESLVALILSPTSFLFNMIWSLSDGPGAIGREG
jgi:hypothetical protein